VLQLDAVAWIPGDLALPYRRVERRRSVAKTRSWVVGPHSRDWPRSSPLIFTSIGATPAARWVASWPIATGVIEGACRHLIADRLDIGGARWGLDGDEAVLTLRAAISNGDFEEYCRFHLQREHQRLYPGIKQGQYMLSA
jgi:hypothetical protein